MTVLVMFVCGLDGRKIERVVVTFENRSDVVGRGGGGFSSDGITQGLDKCENGFTRITLKKIWKIQW